MEYKQSHSNQQLNASFQPHLLQQRSPLEDAALKPTSLHSSSHPHPSLNPERSQTYTIHKGDTLWDIAQHQWGDGRRWHELQKPNGSHFTEQEAHKLQIGTSIHIPEQQATGAFYVKPYTNGFGGNPHEIAHQGGSDRLSTQVQAYSINIQLVNSNQPTGQAAIHPDLKHQIIFRQSLHPLTIPLLITRISKTKKSWPQKRVTTVRA